MAVEVAAARRPFTREEYYRMAYDRSTKLKLYAAAGIPEYWVVDCVAESIEVHRTPHADGYRDTTRVSEPAATVALQALPNVALALTEIFA